MQGLERGVGMGLDSTRIDGRQAGVRRQSFTAPRPSGQREAEVIRAACWVGGSRRAATAGDGVEAGQRSGLCGVRARREALAKVHLHAMAVDFPEVHGHPNRLPFEGVLTLVDVASDKAPSGSRGHRVVLTKAAAEMALPSLLGMAVGYKTGWDGHDARLKCGIITAAELDGRRLVVSGFLFARDFPEFGRDGTGGSALEDGAMGMSYELADAHVADMQASIWTLTRATFTGAAILLREKAAYRSTSFRVKRPTCAGGRAAAAKVH